MYHFEAQTVHTPGRLEKGAVALGDFEETEGQGFFEEPPRKNSPETHAAPVGGGGGGRERGGGSGRERGRGRENGAAGAGISCPSCGGTRAWKDGLRRTGSGAVQRYLCRACGLRFSESTELKVKVNVTSQPSETTDPVIDLSDLQPGGVPPLKQRLNDPAFPIREDIGSHEVDSPSISTLGKALNTFYPNNRNRRVRAEENEAKNLAEVEINEKQAAGATEQIADAKVKGKIVEFLWWLKRQGYKDSTVRTRTGRIKRLADLNADLLDPESVKDVIARHDRWSEGTKTNCVVAYSSFLKMLGKTWNAPRYKVPDKLPFIPLESEIDGLINSCGRRTACFLQGLKDTGADPGELARLEWTEINYGTKSVTIGHPVKGHSSRVVPVSDAFLGRLSTMPKTGDRVFCNITGLSSNFRKQRQRCAQDQSNPRILKITFTTLRHWKGTMEYHRTKDILHVKQLLGHKSVQNTMKYINLEAAVFQPESDEFTVRVARSLDEACKLVEAGFDYVTDMEDGKIFRHRK